MAGWKTFYVVAAIVLFPITIIAILINWKDAMRYRRIKAM